MLTSVFGTIVIGFLIGLLARALAPGPNPSGCIVTILIGIAGAVFATWFGQQVGWYAFGENAGFFAAVLGAVVVLVIFGAIARARR